MCVWNVCYIGHAFSHFTSMDRTYVMFCTERVIALLTCYLLGGFCLVKTLHLTHRGRYKMVAILQTTFSNHIFFCTKLVYFNTNITKICTDNHINNMQGLVQVMTWFRVGDKPLYEQIMTWTGWCVARPHRVKRKCQFYETFVTDGTVSCYFDRKLLHIY